MGLFGDILKRKDEELSGDVTERARKRELSARRRKAKSEGGDYTETATDTLENEQEVERLSQYIADDEAAKIFDPVSALKHGVNKIGTKRDPAGALSWIQDARLSAKKAAARYLSMKWAARNLVEKIRTKAGKELTGKMVSKNVYIKKVTYTRAGKVLSYLQARNLATGRVVGMKTARGLLTRAR